MSDDLPISKNNALSAITIPNERLNPNATAFVPKTNAPSLSNSSNSSNSNNNNNNNNNKIVSAKTIANRKRKARARKKKLLEKQRLAAAEQAKKKESNGAVAEKKGRGRQNPKIVKNRGKGNNNNNAWKKQSASSIIRASEKQQVKVSQWIDKGLSKLSAEITVKLESASYECLVCMEKVRRHAAVWTCDACFALFHIACIRKWANRAVRGAAWRCPACQAAHAQGRPRASCLCGSAADKPADDRYLVAHSCGETCGRELRQCEHPCTLSCHAGPCPPCLALGPLRACHCGETDYRARCSDTDAAQNGRSCGGVCDKPLRCGEHRCEAVCHAGACEPCAVRRWQRCHCGRESEQRACGVDTLAAVRARRDAQQFLSAEQEARLHARDKSAFSCGAACGDALECGNHTCADACHAGECAPCAATPTQVTHCPCGKVPLGVAAAAVRERPREMSEAEWLCRTTVRESCTDAVPTCGQTCGRLLGCGKHRCSRKCHLGECGACTLPVPTRCRCGASSAKRPCQAELVGVKPLLCARPCGTMRECGRHKCQVRCCAASRGAPDIDGVHFCRKKCNRKLGCGQHRCQELCHPGGCRPCLQATFDEWQCACGGTRLEPPISCGTPRPVCRLPCRIERECGHVDGISHVCHEGGVERCPPCSTLVPRDCLGGHGARIVKPCHISSVLCGKLCDKLLVCELHHCQRRCHDGECTEVPQRWLDRIAARNEDNDDADDDDDDEPRPSCGTLCLAPRGSCEHSCQQVCHPAEECPAVACSVLATLRCKCGRRTSQQVCGRGAANSDDGPLNRELLTCDEACVVEQRREQLANAFGIGGRDNGAAPLYADKLTHFALASPVFVRSVERTFAEIISANHVPIGGSLRLPAMDSMRRQIVHMLARHYFLQTESIGEEPHRRVVLVRCADSRLPTVSLGETVHPNVPKAVGLAAVHFGELSSGIRTHHLKAALSVKQEENQQEQQEGEEENADNEIDRTESLLASFDHQYKLVWLDDRNALAVFADRARALAALAHLKSSALPFTVCLFDDLQPSLYGDLSTSMVRHEQQQQAKALLTEPTAEKKPKRSAPKPGEWVSVASGRSNRNAAVSAKSAATKGGLKISKNKWEFLGVRN